MIIIIVTASRRYQRRFKVNRQVKKKVQRLDGLGA